MHFNSKLYLTLLVSNFILLSNCSVFSDGILNTHRDSLLRALASKEMSNISAIISEEKGIRIPLSRGIIRKSEEDWLFFQKKDFLDYYYGKKIKMESDQYGGPLHEANMKKYFESELFLYEKDYAVILNTSKLKLNDGNELSLFPINMKDFYPDYKSYRTMLLNIKNKNYYLIYYLRFEDNTWKIIGCNSIDKDTGGIAERDIK